jgi:uncharacterized membrane protein YidH (DUF202 family)
MGINEKTENSSTNDASININYLTLRRYLGILGLCLPLVLIFGNDFVIESSISHYYYTDMSVFFTGTLIAFGLFLISYRGYPAVGHEILSDNIITNVAGILAFITAIIPTGCEYCDTAFPNGHNDVVRNATHLISAGLFIALMGYMSFNQFTKSDKKDALSLRRKKIYRVCGLIIWGVVILLLLKIIIKFEFSPQDVFWGETIALFAFGFAWLIKSKSLHNIGL